MKKLILMTGLVFTSIVCFGHGDHAPRIATCAKTDCTKEQVEAAVPKAVEMLVGNGKIASSWTSAKIEKIEQKQFKKGTEWMATLFDDKQKDPSKQRLYIFITNKGFLNGSNFTGE